MYNRFLNILLVVLLVLIPASVGAQVVTASFKDAADSISAHLIQYTTVNSPVKIERVTRRGNLLDFRFSQELEDHPLAAKDTLWLREEIIANLPKGFSTCRIGNVTCVRQPLKTLVLPPLTNSGNSVSSRFRTKDWNGSQIPLVEQMGTWKYNKGLTGRHIALWQSHGRYFEETSNSWEWQRPTLFSTVEDMFTQGFVLPFLIPMLENAGAYVITPRERDIQRNEIICDNDPSFEDPREGLMRKRGSYSESGAWSDAGMGFADAKAAYSGWENPFTMGTVRKASCVKEGRGSEAIWTAEVPETGEYAVYVSYKTLPNSTEAARYTIRYAGGRAEFAVNQKMGGGTWIYLGTFPFRKGREFSVTLDCGTPEGRTFQSGTVVTADAVKIGGGMGKIIRGEATGDEAYGCGSQTSGLPCFAEGALYWLQFAGIDSTLHEKWDREYTKEFATRGAWVGSLTGGSRVNPNAEGKNIPIDLSFALHSDAGVTPNDSIVGTLSIYTLVADGSTQLPNGEDRWQCREYADYVQAQVVNDIRSEFDSLWSKRMLWNRSYSESRTTTVPGVLLELLSHQNFADMKHGLDPLFRFKVSRAIYKGILKYLSNRFGCSYAVQPLPVRSFAAVLSGSEVSLSWEPTIDSLEATATPSGYMVYSRIDNGEFDNGMLVSADPKNRRVSIKRECEPGHLYSYKVVAFNEGGKSFPSEILSVGVPLKSGKGSVVIVNNFDRVGPPAWFDTPTYAGFDHDLDPGMPYLRDVTFIGEQYQFRRMAPYVDNNNPGFGGSYMDQAAQITPGNTFDYPYVHGRSLMDAGYAFFSLSRDAFCENSELWKSSVAADIICGKQVTTMVGRGASPNRHEVFPKALQSALRGYTDSGRGVLISGANIGTDVWDQVYPICVDTLARESTQKFVKEVLGYKWLSNNADRSGTIWAVHKGSFNPRGIKEPIEYINSRNTEHYWVSTPDGIGPASRSAHSFLRYGSTNVSAGVAFDGRKYRVVSMGVPLEVFRSERDRRELMSSAMSWILEKSKSQ